MDDVREPDDRELPTTDDEAPHGRVRLSGHTARCGGCGRFLRLLEEELLDPTDSHLCWSCAPVT